MQFQFPTLAATALVFLSGCVSPAKIDYDRSAVPAMANYRCFAIDTREARADYQELALSPIVDRRIESAIETTLHAKGFRSDCGTPDFRVTFSTITETKTEIADLRVGPTPFRREPYFGYGEFSPLWVQEFEEGTFIIDIIDRERSELVWRGVHTERLGWDAPNDSEVLAIVSKLLADFPPTVP